MDFKNVGNKQLLLEYRRVVQEARVHPKHVWQSEEKALLESQRYYMEREILRRLGDD